MFHSIDILVYSDWYNTWSTWFLIPKTRPVVNPPEVRTKLVEVPGRNGALDLSPDILDDNNKLLWGTRKGSWEFVVANKTLGISGLEDAKDVGAASRIDEAKWLTWLENGIPAEKSRHWYEVYTDIVRRIHGRRARVVLNDEPDVAYFGRLSVNEWRSEEKWSTITIDYELQPFKITRDTTDPAKASVDPANGGL